MNNANDYACISLDWGQVYEQGSKLCSMLLHRLLFLTKLKGKDEKPLLDAHAVHNMHCLLLLMTNKGTKKQPLLNAYALAVVAGELSFRAGGQFD